MQIRRECKYGRNVSVGGGGGVKGRRKKEISGKTQINSKAVGRETRSRYGLLILLSVCLCFYVFVVSCCFLFACLLFWI